MRTLLSLLVSLGLLASFLLACLSLPSRMADSERARAEQSEREMEIRALEARLKALWSKTPHEHVWHLDPVPAGSLVCNVEYCLKCGVTRPWTVKISY